VEAVMAFDKKEYAGQKRQALAKQFANKGAAGDIKAAKVLLELIHLMEREHDVSNRAGQHHSHEAARERLFRKLDEMRTRMLEVNNLHAKDNTH
jgi:homoserine kinase